MTRRIALRPLARILEARQKGENPDAIEPACVADIPHSFLRIGRHAA